MLPNKITPNEIGNAPPETVATNLDNVNVTKEELYNALIEASEDNSRLKQALDDADYFWIKLKNAKP